jgi:hypothetical protein
MSIPVGTKFIGISPNVNTAERKSAQANSPSEVYTIEDIKDGGVPDSRTITINGTTSDLTANRTYTVTDANLSTSDITTNNVSTSKHGFAPKAPNDIGQFLSGDGTWRTINTGLTVGTTAVTSGTDGRVFFQAGGVLQQSANLFWDNTNNRLGINTATPTVALDVTGAGRIVTNLGGTGTSFSVFYQSTELFRIQENAIMFSNSLASFTDSNTLNIFGGRSQTYGVSIRNANLYDSTNVTRNLLRVQNTVQFSSGSTTDYRMLIIDPTINVTGGTSTIRGLYYNPTLTSITGVTHRAIETTTGDVVFASTSGNVAIGSSSPGARLDVRAQGALSTDIAFRVRNSADSADIFSIRGNNDIYLPAGPVNNKNTIFHGSASLLQYSSDATQNIAIGSSSTFNNLTLYNTVLGGSASTGSSANFAVSIGWSSFANAEGAINIGRTRASGSYSIRIGYDGGASSYGGTNSIHLGRTVSGNNITPDDVFMTYFNSQSSSTLTRANGSFGLLGQQAYIIANGTGALGLTTFMGDGGNTFVVRNHPNVPSLNITDSFQQYSADITAGNAAPHFRTENGAIVKVYQETTGVAASTFAMNTSGILNDTATFDGYTIGQVVKALRNLGILA